MCECFKVGGPFIAEDPDCPIHGRDKDAARAEFVDQEALGWAYSKLCAFGMENASMESAMMMDRLKLMLGGY